MTQEQERTITANEVSGFDPASLSADFYDNPFPTYAALQRMDPVHRCPDGSFFLTRYHDLKSVYQDAKVFSSDKKTAFAPKFGDGPLYQHHTTSLVFNDPPLHTRVRKIITAALTRGTVANMEQNVRVLVNRLLDRMEAQGRFDAIEDYSAMIPIEVIGNLLRIPHAERGPLRGWSIAILGALEPAISADVLNRGNRAVEDFLTYLKKLVAERKRNLSQDEDDLLSRLIQGLPEGENLSEQELLHNCIFILNAGHETTTNIIGNSIHLLLQNPEIAKAIFCRDNPKTDSNRGKMAVQRVRLMNSAVEELLRYESPNQLGNRVVTQNIEIQGIPMTPGTQLTLCIGAANRDPEVFERPQEIDIYRNPNKHLAFASGPHLCAGGHVARMETRIALEEFFRRFPEASLAGTAVRSRRARFRGFLRVPVLSG